MDTATVALNERIRHYRVTRFLHRLTVDGGTFLEALELLGDSWELRAWPRYRSALDYTTGVRLPAVDLRQHLAGVDAWKSDRRVRVEGVRFAITESGRLALDSSPREDTDD